MGRWIRHAAALVALLPCVGKAQVAPLWRNVDISRQLRDSQPQRVRVQYRAGKVDVRGSSDPVLYAMHLRYDEANSSPLHRHDLAQRSTLLGAESSGKSRYSGNSESGELRLTLPRAVPLDLDFELGATEAAMDLGDMSLQSLRLECGGADASLQFSRPNRVRMRELELNVGAADFTAMRLANANAEQIRLRGGVGGFDLDFSGTWTHDVAVTARVVMGKLTLRVPPDVGLQVDVQRVVTSFEHTGLVKKDDGWYSANFDTAKYKLRIHAETFIGQIEVLPAAR